MSERHIALSVLRLLEIEKTVVEGGGVVGLAALLANKLPELKGKKVVVALCGGNIDITVLGRVIERGLAADGRLIQVLKHWDSVLHLYEKYELSKKIKYLTNHLVLSTCDLIQFNVAISDRPGGLAKFTGLVAEIGASIKDIHHERAFLDTDMMTINVRCVVETRDTKHTQQLLRHLTDHGHVINMESFSIHILKNNRLQIQDSINNNNNSNNNNNHINGDTSNITSPRTPDASTLVSIDSEQAKQLEEEITIITQKNLTPFPDGTWSTDLTLTDGVDQKGIPLIIPTGTTNQDL